MRGIKEVDVVLQNKSLPLKNIYEVGVSAHTHTHTHIYMCYPRYTEYVGG